MENEYNDRNNLRNLVSERDQLVADDYLPEGGEIPFGTRRSDSSLRNDDVHEDREEDTTIGKRGNQTNDDDHEKEKEEAKQMSELFSHIDDFIEAVQSRDVATKKNQSNTTTPYTYKEESSASGLLIADSEMAAESSVRSNKEMIILNQPIDAKEFGRMEPLQLEKYKRLLSHSPMTPFSSYVGDVTLREYEDDKKAAANDTKESKVRRRRRRITFPQQLHAMLETAQENGHDDIISWQKNGKAFMVKDKERFVTTMLPNYFNQTKYRSFQRQLALYGFMRYTIAKSDDYGSYYHPNFVQGNPSLCHLIHRKEIKGSAAAAAKGSLSLSQPTDPDVASSIHGEGDHDDAGHNNNSGDRVTFVQNNIINPLNLTDSIPLDNPRNLPQHKKSEINKSTASKHENQPRKMVINDSTPHDSNMKDEDSYY